MADQNAEPTNFTLSPDAERVKQKQGKDVKRTDHPDATEGQPVTAAPANQTPMVKPVTDAPAFAGPDNEEFPTPAEQSAPTMAEDPLAGIEVDGPSPVLGAPIGVNSIVPQATEVVTHREIVVQPDVPPEMTGRDVLVPMKHPEGGSTDLFDADDEGRVMVPADMVPTMTSHGFAVATDDDHPVEEQ